jgi:hypothetical protein
MSCGHAVVSWSAGVIGDGGHRVRRACVAFLEADIIARTVAARHHHP